MRHLSVIGFLLFGVCQAQSAELEWVRVSDDHGSFVLQPTGKRFVPWGVNYDHDDSGRLLDEYWTADWQTIVNDFGEIKSLGANCVRIHLQLGRFMVASDRPNAKALAQLAKVVKLAERTGLYLDVTGLACYHKQNIPDWYDALDEEERWAVQALFWQAIARTCRSSPAIFCYDLMNEPVIGGAKSNHEWLVDKPLDGKYFVQRIVLRTGKRNREDVACDWVRSLTSAIRQEDSRHLITVGVIPWAHVWPNAKPIFYSPDVAKHLDFVSVHFYPESGKLEKAQAALRVYDIGKPILVEEMFPLKCSTTELLEFVRSSDDVADGWMSFYWGKPAGEYDQQTIAGRMTADWLTAFQRAAGFWRR